jgi:hypothetical protein
MMELIHSM